MTAAAAVPALALHDVVKTYDLEGILVQALRGVSLWGLRVRASRR